MRITRKKEEAMKKEIASLAIGAFLTGTAAFGQNTTTPVIDDRIINQEKRIQQGQNSGQLTDKEANRLNNRLNKIENDEAKAKADGTVTHQEKKKLNRELNRNSRKIHREKHDKETGG